MAVVPRKLPPPMKAFTNVALERFAKLKSTDRSDALVKSTDASFAELKFAVPRLALTKRAEEKSIELKLADKKVFPENVIPVRSRVW